MVFPEKIGMKIIHLVFILLLVSSCKVGPNYHPPSCYMPTEWISDQESLLSEKGWVPKRWWETLEDPLLSRYIEESALYNRDVKIALTSMIVARSQRTIAASKLYPVLDFVQTYNRNSFNLFGIEGSAESQQNIVPIVTNNQQEIIFTGIDALWELDLFGKTRREIEAASARIGSAYEHYHDVLITIFGEVARNYIEVRSNQEKIRIATSQIEMYEQSLKLVSQKTNDGISSQIELNEIEAELDNAQAGLTVLYSNMYGAIFRLSTLLGRFPEHLLEELHCQQPLPIIPEIVQTGMPSELLRRRPDIRKAERELAAATADIGVAVGDFFPRFSLTGIIGHQKFKTNLLTQEGFVWSYSTFLLAPIFNAGRTRANVQAKRAEASQAFYSYEKVVFQSVEEVETALTNFTQAQDRVEALRNRWQKTGNVCRLTKDLYQNGTNDLLSLLNAEQRCLEAEKELVDSKTSALLNVVALYKALGGGWEPEECPPLEVASQSEL